MGNSQGEEQLAQSAGNESWAEGPIFKSRLWDVNQKSLYLQNNELIAGYLQAPNSALEEKIFWVRNRAFGQENFPIILSIRGGKSCLACSPGSPPELQLESVNISDLCKDKEASTRFTFFMSNKDGIRRFESAAHPGWFLCTSSKANEPIGLSQVRRARSISADTLKIPALSENQSSSMIGTGMRDLACITKTWTVS